MARWSSRRARPHDDEFPAAWDGLLRRRWQLWSRFPDDERELLGALIQAFVDGRRWEAAHDWRVTDEMRVLIAACASVLVLGFRDELAQGIDPWARVASIIVHPADVTVRGERTVGGAGVVSDSPTALSGEAHLGGPVLLSWRAIASDLAHPRRGRNVVVHEFAHQLDMLDGVADGIPPMPAAHRVAWEELLAHHLRNLRAGRAASILDPYGGKDEVELFAVASELLFTQPRAMAAELPDLHAALCGYYRQDPARLFDDDSAG